LKINEDLLIKREDGLDRNRINLASQQSVLDLVSQVRDVVLMNVYLDLGDLGGSGFWNEGYMSEGREMGRTVYKQPGNEVDRILSQQGGFQVSKGRRKGSKREWKKRKQKARGLLYNCIYVMNA
jgi:hypothetical protein